MNFEIRSSTSDSESFVMFISLPPFYVRYTHYITGKVQLQGGITMKIYRITTITDYGSRFVRTVQADSKLEAITRAYSELAGNENIASVEEV